jgi:hypothetical protein
LRGDKEARRAMAMASLRESWRYAEQQEFDQVSDQEIADEVLEVLEVRRQEAKRENSR